MSGERSGTVEDLGDLFQGETFGFDHDCCIVVEKEKGWNSLGAQSLDRDERSGLTLVSETPLDEY